MQHDAPVIGLEGEVFVGQEQQGLGALAGSRASMEPASGLHPTGVDPARLAAAIRSERVINACMAAKAMPGDVWGQGGEAHYAFLCGLAALLGLESEALERMISESAKRREWWAKEHPDYPMADQCPPRIFTELGFDAIAIEAATAGETCNRLGPKGESAGLKGIAQKKPGDRPPTFPNTASQKDSPDV